MLNLSNYHPDKTINAVKTLTLLDPASMKALDVTFDVHSLKSIAGRPILTRMQKEIQDKVELSEDEAKIQAAKDAAELVTGWTGVSLDGKKALTFSKENAIKLFTEQPWIGAQVTNFAMNVAGNYAPKSDGK